LIINISSISGILPTPLLSVYSASKSYLNTWSKALHSEYKPKGVHVACLTPSFVVSNMSKRSRSSLVIPSPNKYVSSALRSIDSTWFAAGYWVHELMIWGLSLVPEGIAVSRNKSMHEGIQAAALKKLARTKNS